MQTQFVEFHRATCYPETKRDDMTTCQQSLRKTEGACVLGRISETEGYSRNPEILSHGLDPLLNF